MILGPKNAIDLKIINIYNLERTSTLLFSLEIFLTPPTTKPLAPVTYLLTKEAKLKTKTGGVSIYALRIQTCLRINNKWKLATLSNRKT